MSTERVAGDQENEQSPDSMQELDGWYGWTNEETHAVRFWMIHDASDFVSWQDYARELLGQPDLFTDRSQVCGALAREIREEAENCLCSLSHSLVSSLAHAALGKVNWSQLAERLVNDLREEGN